MHTDDVAFDKDTGYRGGDAMLLAVLTLATTSAIVNGKPAPADAVTNRERARREQGSIRRDTQRAT